VLAVDAVASRWTPASTWRRCPRGVAVDAVEVDARLDAVALPSRCSPLMPWPSRWTRRRRRAGPRRACGLARRPRRDARHGDGPQLVHGHVEPVASREVRDGGDVSQLVYGTVEPGHVEPAHVEPASRQVRDAVTAAARPRRPRRAGPRRAGLAPGVRGGATRPRRRR
jgi:hypothetical protein